MKRVGDGETHWHADLAMAPLDTNALVTCWIPLQPVPAEASGGSGLVFAGGSHRDVALPFWHGDPREAGDVSRRGYVEGSCGAMRLGDAWLGLGFGLGFGLGPYLQGSCGAMRMGDASWHHNI